MDYTGRSSERGPLIEFNQMITNSYLTEEEMIYIHRCDVENQALTMDPELRASIENELHQKFHNTYLVAKSFQKDIKLIDYIHKKINERAESQEVKNFYRSFVGVFKQFIQVAIYGCSSFIVLNFSVTSGPARPVFCRGTVFVTFRVYQSVSVHY